MIYGENGFYQQPPALPLAPLPKILISTGFPPYFHGISPGFSKYFHRGSDKQRYFEGLPSAPPIGRFTAGLGLIIGRKIGTDRWKAKLLPHPHRHENRVRNYSK